jgi:2-polyprenyl-3-methyl-5-hydroxy-6-metoxy-1,4-benzoquinol methylase
MLKVWYSEVSKNTIEQIKQNIDYNALSKREHLKILDFGCGNGRYMRILQTLFPKADIFGADIDKENIENLKGEFKNLFILSPQKMGLDFEDNYFDLVFSSNVIEHIPHQQYLEYIHKIHKILKSNSKFVFGTPNYPYKRFYDMKKAFGALLKLNFYKFRYYLFDDPTHINPLNYKKLEDDFQIFSVLELKPTTIFLKKIFKDKKYSDKINGIAIK